MKILIKIIRRIYDYQIKIFIRYIINAVKKIRINYRIIGKRLFYIIRTQNKFLQ